MNVKNTLLLFITISLFTIFLYYIKKEIGSIKPTPIIYDIKSDSLNKLIDSLNEELFKKDVIIGKYDIALDILKESEPEAANTFENILKNKTE